MELAACAMRSLRDAHRDPPVPGAPGRRFFIENGNLRAELLDHDIHDMPYLEQ